METDRDYQIRHLDRILNAAAMSPVFRRNPKFDVDGIPRIAYSDVMDRKLIIRCDFDYSGNSFWDGPSAALASYDDVESLVDDGWRLD